MGPLAQALISLDSQAVCEVTKPQSQTGLSDGSKSFTSWGEEKPSLRSCSQSGQQDSRRVGAAQEMGVEPSLGKEPEKEGWESEQPRAHCVRRAGSRCPWLEPFACFPSPDHRH